MKRKKKLKASKVTKEVKDYTEFRIPRNLINFQKKISFSFAIATCVAKNYS
jgi:hypothetical protein